MGKVFVISLLVFILSFALSFTFGLRPVDSQIFVKEAAQESQKDEILTKILLGGDVMLGRGVMIRAFGLKDFSYPICDILNHSKACLFFKASGYLLLKNSDILEGVFNRSFKY